MIWGELEKNIRLEFGKRCVIPERFALFLIKQKNLNKRFGEFEFQYFGGSDVANKLYNNYIADMHAQRFLKVYKILAKY